MKRLLATGLVCLLCLPAMAQYNTDDSFCGYSKIVTPIPFNNWLDPSVSPIYSNLLAWYDFSTNGATGTNWADSSTNGYTAYSATTTNYGLTWSGANGGKIVMDGGTNANSGVFAANLGGVGKLSISNSTASFWVRPDFSSDGSATSDGLLHHLFTHHVNGSSNTNAMRLRVSSSSYLVSQNLSATNGAVGLTPSAIITVTSNQWMHVAVTMSAPTSTTATVVIYVNGMPFVSGSNTRMYGAVSGTTRIGLSDQTASSVQPWKGDIADVRFFNRALTSDEIRYWLYIPDKHGGTNYP